MRAFITTSAFALIAVGTIGLLLNEFVRDSTTTRSVIFAVVDFVGLVNWAFAHFAMSDKGSFVRSQA